VLAALEAAPLDDETEDEDEGERRAVAEAQADRELGIQPMALESVLAEFYSDR
jgi:hypothetical protein